MERGRNIGMSVESVIAMQLKNGEYVGVYCDTNVTLDELGLYLFLYYNTEEKVTELIKLGHLYKVGATIGKAVNGSDLSNLELNQVIAKARDLGEPLKGIKAKNLQSLERGKYTYVYKDGDWYYAGGKAVRLSKVEIALPKDEKIAKMTTNHKIYRNLDSVKDRMLLQMKLKKIGIDVKEEK